MSPILQVLSGLHHEWLEKNVEAALKERNEKIEDQEKGEFVEVDE